MLNNFMVVGRLTSDPEVKEREDGKKVTTITLAVNRGYKNADGVYETDFLDIVLWDLIATDTTEYCRKGDIVGAKGRLQTRYEEVNGEKHKYTDLVAEKITFLSSKKEEE